MLLGDKFISFQIAVLAELSSAQEIAGDVLRDAVEKRTSMKIDLVDFYGAMSKMEDAELIARRNEKVEDDGFEVTTTYYTIIQKGRDERSKLAVKSAQNFSGKAPGGLVVNHGVAQTGAGFEIKP